MRTLRLVIGILCILSVPLGSLGQENEAGQTFLARSTPGGLENSSSRIFSILDPSRLSMSQSYMVSFFSQNGEGRTLGMYMNTMKYQFSDPLSLVVHLGYVHQPFIFQQTNGLTQKNHFLSGFELTYQPKKNFFLKIEYGAVPYQNEYNRYRMWGR